MKYRDKRWAVAYAEVYEDLKYVPRESVDKIPEAMLRMFDIKRDKTYQVKLDFTKDFADQDISSEARAIFANIYTDYWATPDERADTNAHDEQLSKRSERERYKKMIDEEEYDNSVLGFHISGSILEKYIEEGKKTVIIPNGITSIGYGAFLNCDNLSSVSIPKSVTSIDEEAFKG